MNKVTEITEKDIDGSKAVKSASVEDALSLIGFGKYNYALLLVCSGTLTAMGMDMFGSTFVTAASVCDLELTLQQRTLLTSMPFIGVVAGAQLWGYVSDTKGRRLTLIISMGIGFVFGTLSSFSPNWKTMAILKLISSIFTSASNSAAYTLLGESCSAKSRGRAMLLCCCPLMCAQAISATVTYPILQLTFSYPIGFLGITFSSWRLLALVMALPCAITAVLLPFFHESPKFLASQGKSDEALNALKSIYHCNYGHTKGDFAVTKLNDDELKQAIHLEGSFLKCVWQQTKLLFTPPLLTHSLKLFYLVTVIYSIGNGYMTWLPFIVNSLITVVGEGSGSGMNLCAVIKHHNEHMPLNVTTNVTSSVCDATIKSSSLFLVIAYGGLATSIGILLSLTCGHRKRMGLLTIFTMAMCCGWLLNLVKIPIAGGILYCIFILGGVCTGLISVYCVELYPTTLRGMVSCLVVMVGRLSAFIGINVIGAILPLSCEATFYAGALYLIGGIIVAWFLPRDKNPNMKIESL